MSQIEGINPSNLSYGSGHEAATTRGRPRGAVWGLPLTRASMALDKRVE